MGKKVVGGMLLLIGGYLILVNYQGAVKDTQAGSAGTTGIIKALQGR